jgi:cleavage and polyadenylation specificity factor subunit 1
MTLLPRTKTASILPGTSESLAIAALDAIADHEILITTTTGAMFLLSPLTESQYRRLGTVANHLSNILVHPCGLNPKAYRTNPNAPEPVIGGRPIVDGEVLFRWVELGSQRRAEIAGRVGGNIEVIRDDLEDLRGGLGYL